MEVKFFVLFINELIDDSTGKTVYHIRYERYSKPSFCWGRSYYVPLLVPRNLNSVSHSKVSFIVTDDEESQQEFIRQRKTLTDQSGPLDTQIRITDVLLSLPWSNTDVFSLTLRTVFPPLVWLGIPNFQLKKKNDTEGLNRDQYKHLRSECLGR